MLENFLMILVEQFCIILCLFALYGKKFRLDAYTMCVIVINMLTLYIKQLGYINHMTTIWIFIFILLYSLYEFDKNIKLAATNNALYFIIISLLQLICTMPVMLLQYILDNDAVIVTILNVIVLLIVICLRKRINILANTINSKKWSTLIPVFVCFFMVVMLLVKYKSYGYLPLEIYSIGIVFLLLAIVLTQKWQESRMEADNKKLELEMLTAYNEAFEILIADIRRQQHDVKNHINAIYSQHYTNKTYEELVESQKKYCEFVKVNNKYDKLLSINNTLLGGFLYSKFQAMYQEGIDVEYDIALYTNETTIPSYELISILGVLIDNATEKTLALDLDNKMVMLSVQENEQHIKIYVKNRSEYIKYETLFQMFEEGYSTKGKGRGVGLYNVKEKSKKYNFDISVENQEIDGNNWISFGIIIKK